MVSYGTDADTGETMTITASDGATIAAEVAFAGRSGSYTLYVTPRIQAENLAGAGPGADGPLAAAGAAGILFAVRFSSTPGTSPGPSCA